MSGALINVSLDNAESTIATVRDLAARARDRRGLWEAIGMSLVTSTQMRFERGVAPDGSAWPASVRVQLGQGEGKTLIDSGRLLDSITFEADDRGVDVGTNVIYAAVHQFGATIRPVNAAKLHFKLGGEDFFLDEVTIPARPYLGLDDDDEAEIIRIAEEWLLEELGDDR